MAARLSLQAGQMPWAWEQVGQFIITYGFWTFGMY